MSKPLLNENKYQLKNNTLEKQRKKAWRNKKKLK